MSVAPIDALIYVPNSTGVNDLPVRDAGAQSPLMHERGIVMSDVDAGVEATIRWREVVHNGLPSGEAIVRVARIEYDGDRADDITARELKVRCAPAFANTIAGLPFGLDGMLGPAFGGGQRAIAGSDFVELPPATPVVRDESPANGRVLSLAPSSNGTAHPDEAPHAEPYDRAALERRLRFLKEARFPGLVTHLFAIRALLPDTGDEDDEARTQLRETLDRVYIKLRMPNYVIAPRDLERPGSTAEPWAALARRIPEQNDALRNYREQLIAALDGLASADETAFIDALQRRPYPVLDAALEVVRAHFAAAHA